MSANQPPWPREWLMTDERVGNRLWQAVAALPRGAGVVFRHHATLIDQRPSLAHKLASACRERGLILSIAGDVDLAIQVEAAMVHNPNGDPGELPFSSSAHSLEEADRGCRSGASLVFLSPIYPTRSHPDRPPLPSDVARQVVAACPVPVIALGGMNRSRFSQLQVDGFYGWAGIDAWLGEIRT